MLDEAIEDSGYSGSSGGNMSVSVIGSAGLSKGKKTGSDVQDLESSKKPRSKLFSLESHLNYKIALPKEVTLIPNIGLRYEYEKAVSHKEQIARNHTIERGKKSHQYFSTEIGSRVIFAPIKLKDSTASTISITPTAHFGREKNR
ncbi:autotransporter domain-containing protein [Rickettsia tamurae]|uniref:autotransporter domain-containing protein n=1 Tax=Rickettsia tamurae TaxID=334545 RepID=UPI00050A1FF1|nr:autotransporter domain-containing protein [Rickettsia tamurae]